MQKNQNYVTYTELADALGCSYSTLYRRHKKQIEEMFDATHVPKRGLIPIEVCEEYFGISLRDNKKTR